MKVGITACSNGQQPEQQKTIDRLIKILSQMGFECVLSEHLYAKDGVFSGTAKERADDLMAFYEDSSIDAVYDLSGGDIANEVLGFLDYDMIAKSEKQFWGYSDLTTILNAVYAKTGRASVLYQVKHLVGDDGALRRERFRRFVLEGGKDLFQIQYEFLQCQRMEGIVVGGNIRCLLKLAGTPYFPDMHGKILLMESLGGSAPQVASQVSQLAQMGVFDAVAGVLLGTFTRLEAEGRWAPFELLASKIRPDLPVAWTPEVGHGEDAKAVMIGKFLRLAEN